MTGVNQVPRKSGSRKRRDESTDRPRPERRCYHCGKTGHLIAKCPTRTSVRKKEPRPRLARAEEPEKSDPDSDSLRVSDDDEESGKD